MTHADIIRHHMTTAGHTITSLAQAIGQRRSQLSRLLSGRHDVRLSTLGLIADALGMTVSQLLTAPKNFSE